MKTTKHDQILMTGSLSTDVVFLRRCSLRAGSLVWVGDKKPRTGEPGEENEATGGPSSEYEELYSFFSTFMQTFSET